jgi:uncharacterized membrane protein
MLLTERKVLMVVAALFVALACASAASYTYVKEECPDEILAGSGMCNIEEISAEDMVMSSQQMQEMMQEEELLMGLEVPTFMSEQDILMQIPLDEEALEEQFEALQ